jgi:hypothetical protein
MALFGKIRQICTSPIGLYGPLNRGEFRHLVYPIRTPKRLPEHQYEGHFFRAKIRKNRDQGICHEEECKNNVYFP